MNSECVRRTSRNCVVRNFGRLVYLVRLAGYLFTGNTTSVHKRRIVVRDPFVQIARVLLSWLAACIVVQLFVVAQLGTVLHRVVAAEQHTVPVGIAAAHHPRHSLLAYFAVDGTNLAIPGHPRETPHSGVADTICREHLDNERHLNCLVG